MNRGGRKTRAVFYGAVAVAFDLMPSSLLSLAVIRRTNWTRCSKSHEKLVYIMLLARFSL